MNIDHLSELGYYLSSEGVENWRLSVVIPHDTLLTDNALNIYNKLNSLFPEINIRISNIDLKQTKHIVLIDPKGDLILRGNVNNNKEKVCCLLSEQMSKDDILNLIDHSDHMNRYMYLPANKFIHLR